MNNDVTWSLLRNTFDNVTKTNMKRAYMMARDHRDKLKGAAMADPDLQPIYSVFETNFDSFEAKYQSVNSNFALYQSQTMQVEGVLNDLMGSLARRWDVTVQVEHDQNSAEYKAIFPDGRRPFQTGAYDLRLAAVGTLIQNLKTSANPAFTTLIANIDAWLKQAQVFRSKQQQTEARDQTLRQELETERQNLMQAMHRVFFEVCAYYIKTDDLVKVESLYELKYLRTTPSKSDNAATKSQTAATSLQPLEQKVLLRGTFGDNQDFEFKNTGNGNLLFWLADNENATPPNDVFNLSAGATATINGFELGSGATQYGYLLVRNTDDTQLGRCEVVITEL